MRRWISGFSLFVTVTSLLFSSAAGAVSAPVNGSPGQGLEISPPVVELQVDPGQSVSTEIRIRNVTRGELIAKGRADDFGAGKDESGQPQLLLDEAGATRYSLKYWVASVPDVDLAPQELKQVSVTINVPKNAEPGGHYGVIRFTALPPNMEGTGVALSASVGTLVLLKVRGEIKENLNLSEFSTGQNKRKTNFFEYSPVDFVVRLQNTGSVHEKPVGSIVVKDMFGKQVSSLALNPKGGSVLPDSIRRFENSMDNKKVFGRYTAKLELTYSDSKKLSSSVTFWIVPWRLIILLLIGAVVLFFLMRQAIRRYNQYIIGQARRR